MFLRGKGTSSRIKPEKQSKIRELWIQVGWDWDIPFHLGQRSTNSVAPLTTCPINLKYSGLLGIVPYVPPRSLKGAMSRCRHLLHSDPPAGMHDVLVAAVAARWAPDLWGGGGHRQTRCWTTCWSSSRRPAHPGAWARSSRLCRPQGRALPWRPPAGADPSGRRCRGGLAGQREASRRRLI